MTSPRALCTTTIVPPSPPRHPPSNGFKGVDATIAAIRERVGDRPVYVTFDVDCLDPAFAPGTGTPVMGGLSSAQVSTSGYSSWFRQLGPSSNKRQRGSKSNTFRRDHHIALHRIAAPRRALPAQALAILRGLEGIEIIGADVVEVSPPYDVSEVKEHQLFAPSHIDTPLNIAPLYPKPSPHPYLTPFPSAHAPSVRCKPYIR